MPGTVVLDAAGQVQQYQIGAADIVATVATAHSAWGWIGGLSGISSILRLSQPKNDEDGEIKQLFKALQLDPASCQILGQDGLRTMVLQNDRPFGDTIAAQLVETTLCALNYSVGSQASVNYFIKYFIDGLFRQGLASIPGSREALCTLLRDNCQAILNEGVVHHLDERFDNAIAGLNDAFGLKASTHPRLKFPTLRPDAALVTGFLRWLFTRGSIDPYYTRCAAVARLAACLRCIGYALGPCAIWDGSGHRPSPPRAIVLVIGGCHATDEYMDEHESQSLAADLTTHYKWNTVGAMLWNAFVQESTLSHETFQQDFQDVQVAVAASILSFQWSVVDGLSHEVQAYPVWAAADTTLASRTALCLASKFFRESADRVAPWYEIIANERYLKAVQTHMGSTSSSILPASLEVQRYLALTASICISVLSRACASNFKAIQHATTLDLSMASNVKWLAGEVDYLLHDNGPGMSRVIRALATIHCARAFEEPVESSFSAQGLAATDADGSDVYTIVGWRNGRYIILPQLLFAMGQNLDPSLLRLQCMDTFIGNIPVQTSGSIVSGTYHPGALSLGGKLNEESESKVWDVEKADGANSGQAPIAIGVPIAKTPDIPLYISLERPPMGIGSPELTICGRVNGESIGHVGVADVLKTLVLSWSDKD